MRQSSVEYHAYPRDVEAYKDVGADQDIRGDPEVQKTIRSLDRKIKDLEDTKRKLIETFGGGAPIQPTPTRQRVPPSIPFTAEMLSREPSETSVERFVSFLQAHGPATTAEVVSGTNVKRGSISWLISKSEGRIRRRGMARLSWQAKKSSAYQKQNPGARNAGAKGITDDLT